jgi:hypothetical protein
MSITVKPTASEVIEEGQLKVDYFPNCNTDNDLSAFVRSRIEDVDAEVAYQVGTNYTSTNDNILRMLHKAEIYLTLGRLWQIIKNVMDAYDEESLPPEFVDPEQAAANRKFYLDEGMKVIKRFETTSLTTDNFAAPYFGSAGASEDSPTMLEALIDTFDTPSDWR